MSRPSPACAGVRRCTTWWTRRSSGGAGAAPAPAERCSRKAGGAGGGGGNWRARRMAGWAVGAALLTAALVTAYPPIRLSAQSDPRLQAAVQLAQAGRLDSARLVVRRLLAALSPADSAYPEALYTSAMLAADASTAATNLQRIVVEFGRSPWADDALLRLTQLYFAQGDPAATVQAAERMRRDYPDSPLKPRADFWGARAYFDLKDEAHG